MVTALGNWFFFASKVSSKSQMFRIATKVAL